MAVSKGPISVNCPSCNNPISVSEVRGETTLNCPYCKRRIRISLPGPSQPSDSVYRNKPEDDYYDYYEKDVGFLSSMPLIKNIVLKDVFGLKKLYIVLFIACIIMTALFASVAPQFRSNDIDEYYDDEMTEEERLVKMENQKRRELDDINSFYALIILIMGVLLALVVNHIYGLEIKRGTMRLLALYPLNMNSLTLAKVISALIIIGIIEILVLAIPLSPFMEPDIFPWLSSILVMVYIINSFIIITIAFLSHIITYFLNKLYFSMNRLLAIFFIIYIMLTETMITTIGFIMLSFRGSITDAKFDQLMHNYTQLGQGLGQLSPYHSGGRMLTNALGYHTGGPDLHFILLLGIIFIVAGYILGRKIYMDVFIRD